jgi:hypothetical protein
LLVYHLKKQVLAAQTSLATLENESTSAHQKLQESMEARAAEEASAQAAVAAALKAHEDAAQASTEAAAAREAKMLAEKEAEEAASAAKAAREEAQLALEESARRRKAIIQAEEAARVAEASRAEAAASSRAQNEMLLARQEALLEQQQKQLSLNNEQQELSLRRAFADQTSHAQAQQYQTQQYHLQVPSSNDYHQTNMHPHAMESHQDQTNNAVISSYMPSMSATATNHPTSPAALRLAHVQNETRNTSPSSHSPASSFVSNLNAVARSAPSSPTRAAAEPINDFASVGSNSPPLTEDFNKKEQKEKVVTTALLLDSFHNTTQGNAAFSSGVNSEQQSRPSLMKQQNQYGKMLTNNNDQALQNQLRVHESNSSLPSILSEGSAVKGEAPSRHSAIDPKTEAAALTCARTGVALECGWLFKANHHTGMLSSALAGKWKKHWFVLTQNALSYYEDELPTSNSAMRPMPQVVIPLTPGAMHVVVTSKQEFELVSDSFDSKHVISIKYHHHHAVAHTSDELNMDETSTLEGDVLANHGKHRKLEKFCLRALNAADCEAWNNALSSVLSWDTISDFDTINKSIATAPDLTAAVEDVVQEEASENAFSLASATSTKECVSKYEEEEEEEEDGKDEDGNEREEQNTAQHALDDKVLITEDLVPDGARVDRMATAEELNAAPKELVEGITAPGNESAEAVTVDKEPALIDELLTTEIPEFAEQSRSLSSADDVDAQERGEGGEELI